MPTKLLNIFKTSFIFIFDLILASLVFIVFFNITWLFAHSILDGNLVGNDSRFALGLVEWFAKWLPGAPKWFPGQGTGVSMYYSYPMLPTYSVITLAKFTGLTFIQSYRLISFLIFPLTSLGIYFLCIRLTKSRIAGSLAGVFFLISQASWVFLRLHGIFAQTFSLVFVAPTILFFDKGVDAELEKRQGFSARLNWILASLFMALSFLAHPVTGLVVLGTVILYTGARLLFKEGKDRFKDRLKSAVVTVIKIGIFAVIGIGISAFWLFPFSSYNKLANRDGLNSMGMNQLKEVSLLPKTLLGFNDFAQGDLRYDYFFFALPVWVLFALGVVIGLIKNKKLFSAGLISLAALFYTSAPLFLEAVIKPFRYLFTAVYFRALIIPFIFLPLVAAGGLHDFWDLILGLWRRLIRQKHLKFVLNTLTAILVGVAIIFSGILAIVKLEHQPPDAKMKKEPAYGLTGFDSYGPSLDKNWRKAMTDPLTLFTLPQAEISSYVLDITPHFAKTAQKMGWNQFNRIDISPVVSGGNIVQNSQNQSSVSIVNLYHFFASLIHSMWGYQAGVFFGREPIYENPKLLEELTKWYGIEYVMIDQGWDNPDRYDKAGYEFVEDYIAENGVKVFSLYKFSQSTGIYEFSQKPAFLVIGDYQKGAYEQVFRVGNSGSLPYDSVIIVEGRSRIDDYSQTELKEFDGIILHGYSYKSKAKAWANLSKFVEDGGMLFVNTGWQYVAKDWGSDSGKVGLAEPLPVASSTWKKATSDRWENVSLGEGLGETFDPSSLSPLSWRGDPWGYAGAQRSDLREGAKPILTLGDDVIVASKDFGKGKVIWSGFNFFAHIIEYKNQDEVNFLAQIFNYLLQFNNYKSTKVSLRRDYPDKLEITFSQATDQPQWFLWKESYSPSWHLRDERGEEVNLYRSGPGFMLAKIPTIPAQSRYTLSYKLSFYDGLFAKLVTFASIIFLFSYLFFGNIMDVIFRNKVAGVLKKAINKFKLNFRKDENSDY